MSNLKWPYVFKRSGGNSPGGIVRVEFFFYEGFVREGAVRGGTGFVGELSGGNCPGGIVPWGIYLEPS